MTSVIVESLSFSHSGAVPLFEAASFVLQPGFVGIVGEKRGRTLSILAALGLDPERALVTERPSPGEARKIALALGMGRHAWLLCLDEPSNHLDLPSLERLERALAEFPGAILLVTHDEQLARCITTTTWELSGGRVKLR